MLNFIPDSGKYEIVSYVCRCDRRAPVVDLVRTPLERVAVEVVGWMQIAAHCTDPLPLLPVTLDLHGLRVHHLSDSGIGAPRLGKIDESYLVREEAVMLHRRLHDQES